MMWNDDDFNALSYEERFEACEKDAEKISGILANKDFAHCMTAMSMILADMLSQMHEHSGDESDVFEEHVVEPIRRVAYIANEMLKKG